VPDKMNRLKQCPFCAVKILNVLDDHNKHKVNCWIALMIFAIGFDLKPEDIEDELTKAWNGRAEGK